MAYTFLEKKESEGSRRPMSSAFSGPNPVQVEIMRVVQALQQPPATELESELVDLKEEPGRRDATGAVMPGTTQSEQAAECLAEELACLSNTGSVGGAVILGVADDGTVIGTELNKDWLRFRIYELTDRKLTVTATDLDMGGKRVLSLEAPPAVEPIRYRGKIKHRVGANCVEIDAATWAATQPLRYSADWSEQPSSRTAADVRPGALEVARDFLRAAHETVASEMAECTDGDLLRRLNLCDEAGRLNNAGAVLFCTGPAVLDYRRREVSGGDAMTQVKLEQRSLLEQFRAVIEAIRVHTPQIELGDGPARGQTHRIPLLAVREAVVNGITHRDWHSGAPTEIEHVGDRLTVTSPGGFVGGVSPANIITHPSVPRYPRLAEALRMLRVAERQGIGVDRMHREMLVLGHHVPVIEELNGPYVRASLIGGVPDEAWLAVRAQLQPASLEQDLDILLLLDAVARRGWISGVEASRVLQRNRPETGDGLERLASVTIGSEGPAVVVEVDGDPRGGEDPYEAAWQLTEPARALLSKSRRHRSPQRYKLLKDYARERGRISSTEAASLLGCTAPTARAALEDLVSEGILRHGKEVRKGRGFFYVPVLQPDGGTGR